MKSRIEAALRSRLDDDPENLRLRQQVAQIDRAMVSTLHGFCSGLLRQHFHLVELDPDFVILDPDEAQLLRAEVVEQLFEDRYETDESGHFQKLIDVHGDGRDEQLQEAVVRTHELLCSVADPVEWLATARSRIDEAATKPLCETELGGELVEIVRHRLAALTERCDAAIFNVRRMSGFEKYVEFLVDLGDAISVWSRAFGDCNFDALAKSVAAFDLVKRTKPRFPADKPGRAAAEDELETVRENIGKKGPLRQLIRFSSQEWTDGMSSVAPFANVFLDLVEEFQTRFTAAKQQAGGIDFFRSGTTDAARSHRQKRHRRSFAGGAGLPALYRACIGR